MYIYVYIYLSIYLNNLIPLSAGLLILRRKKLNCGKHMTKYDQSLFPFLLPKPFKTF